MAAGHSQPLDFTVADYRRHARRLRAHFHRRPAQLQRSLAKLALWRDLSRQRQGDPKHTPHPVDARVARVSIHRRTDIAARSACGPSLLHRASLHTPVGCPATDAERFITMVESAIEGSVLRFSRRQELLQTADGMGIERFEANLMIASVQHRHGGHQVQSPAPAEASSHGHLWTMALLFVLIEVAIGLATWWLLHGS